MFESKEVINDEPIVIKIPCISEWKLTELRYTCEKHKVKGYFKMSREELIQEVEKILIKIKEDEEQMLQKLNESDSQNERCKFCQGFQQEELSAGIREGCTIDDLYEDEDCQIINDDVNDAVTAFMLGRINKCKYFKAVSSEVNKRQENVNALLELIKNNPELPIIPMASTEVVGDDSSAYWMGSWGKAEIDRYSCQGERMVYLSDGVEDIFSTVFDDIVPDEITEEEEEEFIRNTVMGMQWTKAIIVRIETPNKIN